MRMPQIRDPSLPKLDDLPDSYKAKVCISFPGRIYVY